MSTSYTKFTSNGGHSAKAPGASSDGFKEHEQTRLCNKAFIKAMKARKYTVVDTTSNGKNKYAVLQEQVARANRVGGGAKQLDLSFHLNATPGGTGTEVYYYSDSVRPLAEKVSAAIASALGVRDRGAKKNQSLYFLKHTKADAILIEVSFIDNPGDMQKLIVSRSKAMDAVANVLVGPAKLSTKPSKVSTSSTTSTTFTNTSAYTGSSVVEYLQSIGKPSSFAARAVLAKKYGIVAKPEDYRGTAAQNISLLKALKGE